MPLFPTPIYHITSVDSLASILAQGGLRSYNEVKSLQLSYVSLAHQTIQERRANKLLPCGPGGTLHHYVPFYFAPRSPMLYTIDRGNVKDYNQGQAPIIHLVSNAQAVQLAGRGFVFTDGHGIVDFSQFYDNLEHLDKVDWKVMEGRYWNDTDIDNDRKRRRQAEFLVHNFFPWSLVNEIGVINQSIKKQVEQTIQSAEHQPPVVVQRDWYY